MTTQIIPYHPDHPLDKMDIETKRSYPAFLDYFNMGAGRSLKKLHNRYLQQTTKEPPTRKWNTITTWCKKYSWVDRVERADKLQRFADDEEWRERRMELREGEWELSTDLIELTKEILAQAPNFVKSKRKFVPGKNGEPDREIITAALDLYLAVKAGETASKLGRLAAGMETENVNANVRVIGIEIVKPEDADEE
jgi:hypothetical protein